MIKLCVNIDHVATIRQARKTVEPDPVVAATEAVLGGADGITLHVREDRRHVQDADLFRLREIIKVPLNLELAPTQDMLNLAIKAMPDMAMIVPEGRNEITTEGGVDVVTNMDSLRSLVQALKDVGIRTSAFVNADAKQIEAANACGFDVCEIHTGTFAETVIKNDMSLTHIKVCDSMRPICEAVEQINELGMQCNAGHGLTHHNVGIIASIKDIEELHIGHSIVSRSVIIGIRSSVQEMKQRMKDAAE